MMKIAKAQQPNQDTAKMTIWASSQRWKPVGSTGTGGGTTRPLPRDGGAEKLRGDLTVEPHPKVWTIVQE